MNVKKAIDFPSKEECKNYKQAMIDRMAQFQTSVEIGHVVTYQELMDVLEYENKDYSMMIFLAAAERVEKSHGIFFRNRVNEGYERVSTVGGFSVIKKGYDQGCRKVIKNIRRTFNLNPKELTANQQNEMLAMQSVHGRLQLGMDTSGTSK